MDIVRTPANWERYWWYSLYRESWAARGKLVGVTRTYRMQARQEAVASTRERILRAAYDQWLGAVLRPGVDRVRRPCGRRLPADRDPAVRHEGRARVRGRRLAEATRGRVPCRRARRHRAARSARLVDRYEAMGDANVRMLELEGRVPAIDHLLEVSRAGHRAWIERTLLPDRMSDDREQVVLSPLCRNGCHGLEAAPPRPRADRGRPPNPSSSDSSAPCWTGLHRERTADHERSSSRSGTAAAPSHPNSASPGG